MQRHLAFLAVGTLEAFILVASFLWQPEGQANPAGPTVSQGTASISTQGSQLIIQQTSDRAFINWQSFNIGAGQTTTFVQPSASSLVWNQINDPNASQILGNLNANGYVVLQNQSGFYIGGQASITAHGLMMTTAPTPMPDLASGGAWQFNLPPPTTGIINYGEIKAGEGGSVFLIAHDVENHGTISAPAGNIGLYAARQVLVSERPDGRGLSAQVTLPEGSVDNSGKLIADAGAIAMRARVVNQGGLIQANSVREVNGMIELVASDSLNLGAASVISAKGDSVGTSPGGFVALKSDGSFADTPTSTIIVAGGTSGGRDGVVEVFGHGANVDTVQSRIDGLSAAQFLSQGLLLVNPFDISLSIDSTDTTSSSPNLNVNDLDGYSRITLFANNDINVNAVWTIPDSEDPKASLTLEAKRNITLSDRAGLMAGRNWSLNMIAGTELTSADNRQAGSDGIYLQGSASIQARNGSINLSAGNEIVVDDGRVSNLALARNGVRTTEGGHISVAARYGDVNTGGNPAGYSFGLSAPPYYAVNQNLGGISTGAGGDVTISARDVISYLALDGNLNISFDGGTGAFGPQPGNVIISAGRSVFGHYVLANGVGTITAGVDVGGATAREGFALSLITGTWNVFAPNGSIYLQEVRNPNGVFNSKANPSSNRGYHLFDYDPLSSVVLDAKDSVEITGLGVPRPVDPVPILFPPRLEIRAGAGGFVLDTSMTLFPSPNGDLTITTSDGGDFRGVPDFGGSYPTLLMSDSGSRQWSDEHPFDNADRGEIPNALNNLDPVEITISGSLKTVNVATTKATHVTVGGDVINSGFFGQNLHPTDVTYLNVVGNIVNRSYYTFAGLSQPIESIDPLNPVWDMIFSLLVNPALVLSTAVPAHSTISEIKALAQSVALFPTPPGGNANPGFVYNAETLRFGFAGAMPDAVRIACSGVLRIIRYGLDGVPVVADGHFVSDPVPFVPPSVIEDIYQRSQDIPKQPLSGYNIGGPGQFNITAASMDLGNSQGIQSWGIGGLYRSLAGKTDSGAFLTDSGAAVSVTLEGDLNMFTSRIASFFGGKVTVVSSGGRLDLGSQDLFGNSPLAYGIYTSGHSDVTVIASKDINVNGSRIAAYNGGEVHVTSLDGNVNAGSGGNRYVLVPIVFRDPPAGEINPEVDLPIYGSGIVATSLGVKYQTPGGNPLPGNIFVDTPHGDIVSQTAGILQLALDGNVSGGPTVTLTAGTKAFAGPPPVAAVAGDIDLGNSGLIGGTIILTAEGNIRGLIVSRQNSIVNAAQNFSGSLISAGTANIAAGGTVSGTIVGISGVSASGSSVTAALLSQNVSVGGGPAQSTLGSSATATSASQSAAQQASNDTKKEQFAKTDDDDEKKKKDGRGPLLTRRVGRVTVILPN